MSSSVATRKSSGAADGPITLAAILSATTSAALDDLAKKIGTKFDTKTNTIPLKQNFMVRFAAEHDMLHESLCAKLVEESPQLQAELTELKNQLHKAQQGIAEAVVVAREAQATADGLQGQVGSLLQMVQELQGTVRGLQEQKQEAGDAPLQQQLADQAIWFASDIPESELQVDSAEQLAAVRLALRRNGIASAVTDTIQAVTVLRKPPGSDKPAPIVLRCQSVADKVGLLRAARAAGTAERGLQVTARLTRWQQEQRKKLSPRLRQLKEQGVEARFYNGHVLQQKLDGRWLVAPLVAAA